VKSIFSYGISIWGGTFNNIIFKLNVTIISILKFVLNLPILTNTILIYEKLDVNNFNVIYNNAVLVDLHKNKHLMPVSHHKHNT